MKKTKAIAVIIMLLSAVMLFSSCTVAERMAEKLYEEYAADEGAHRFLAFEEDDVYTCKVNDDTSFWYCPIGMYGEWTRGETVIPIKMRDGAIGQPRVCHHYCIDFFDAYGCRMGGLMLCMGDNAFVNDDTTDTQSTCLKLEKSDIFNESYRELMEEQLAELEWEGVVIQKEKKSVTVEGSVFGPMEAWAKPDADETLTCEEGGFGFSLSSGKGYWQDAPVAAEEFHFEITAFTPYPAKWYDKELDLSGGFYAEPCVKLYIIDKCEKRTLKSYEIFADGEGYYILYKNEEGTVKARLTKGSEGTV